jgi:hypothetical protein
LSSGKSLQTRRLLVLGPPCLAAVMAITLCACLGYPATLETGFVLFGGVAWSVACLRFFRPPGQWVLAFLCVAGYPYLGILEHRTAAFDLKTGAQGKAVMPLLRIHVPVCMLVFEEESNRALIEHYLGRSSVRRWQLLYSRPGIARDGNDRVDSRSLLFSRSLSAVLSMLPSEEARRRVLTCLTDQENHARAHQGVLLACLMTLGYPPGYDARTWWIRHESLFHPLHDANEAARVVAGWLPKIRRIVPSLVTYGSTPAPAKLLLSQYDAACNQAAGWTSSEFYEARAAFWAAHRATGQATDIDCFDSSDFASDEVAWWKEQGG